MDLLMDEFDRDGDGTVDLDEFSWQLKQSTCFQLVEEFKALVAAQGISMFEVFQEMDENQDGTVDLGEFEGLLLRFHMPFSSKKANTLFSLFDDDGSWA